MGHPCLFRKTGSSIAASLAALVWLGALGASPAHAASDRGTFSIVAYDSVTQELGVAVQSKYFSVGTDVPWAEAGVGAVATQARVDPSFGLKALGLLRTGLRAADVLRALAATDSVWDSRQLGIVDARGGVANWTGSKCLDWAGGEAGADFVCLGNILSGPAVVSGLARASRESEVGRSSPGTWTSWTRSRRSISVTETRRRRSRSNPGPPRSTRRASI